MDWACSRAQPAGLGEWRAGPARMLARPGPRAGPTHAHLYVVLLLET